MITRQTINRLVGQDWTDILQTAAGEMSFKSMTVLLPNDKRDSWLAPVDLSPPPPRYLSPPIARQAYAIGQQAVLEVHKQVSAAAMDGQDRGPAALAAAPSYRALIELLQDDGAATPIDREARTEGALKAYLTALGEAALAVMNTKGPEAIIHLGDIDGAGD